jgi:hypothetical protein
MRSTPRHYYEITYDADKKRYVKRRIHRENCPTCNGLRVPKPRPARSSGEILLEVSPTAARQEKSEPSKSEVSAKESEEKRSWLTPARATILAAIITGLFLIVGVWLTAVLRDPTPAPTPPPNVYVNQQQSVGPSR